MTTSVDHTQDICARCGSVLAMPSDPTVAPTCGTCPPNVLAPMLGAIIENIVGKAGDDELVFHAKDGRQFKFFHHQDCCEHVSIEDVAGDLSDLIGTPILMAEEVSNEPEPTLSEDEYHESCTWTFYKFATIKGSVTVRWLGESNGYYSESVDFIILPEAAA